jgi:hypothetical protein
MQGALCVRCVTVPHPGVILTHWFDGIHGKYRALSRCNEPPSSRGEACARFRAGSVHGTWSEVTVAIQAATGNAHSQTNTLRKPKREASFVSLEAVGRSDGVFDLRDGIV